MARRISRTAASTRGRSTCGWSLSDWRRSMGPARITHARSRNDDRADGSRTGVAHSPLYDGDVGQVAVALGDVEPVADHEVGRDAEPDVAQVRVALLQALTQQQRTDLDARRVAGQQVLAQVLEGEAAVDDVLDEQDVAVR